MSRTGVFTLFLVLILFAGWLFSDDLDKPDLASVIKNIQQTLQQLQGEMKDLKSSVKELSRNAKKEKQPRTAPPASGAASAIPSWQQHQEAYDRARHLEDQKLYGEAIEAYSQAIALDSKNDSAFLHRGYCRYALGDYTNAVSDLTQSLALQPNNSRAYVIRASALADSGQTAAAMEDANEAIRRDAKNPDNYLLRATLHQRAGEPQPAIDDYTFAIAIAPQAEKPYLGRAALLRSQGQMGPSLKDCYKAIELNPSDPAAYLCRAQFYIASGAAQPAIEDINQALLYGQNPAQAAAMISAAKQVLESKEPAKERQPEQPKIVAPSAVDAPQLAPPVAVGTPALPPASGMPSAAALPPTPTATREAPKPPPVASAAPEHAVATRPSPPAGPAVSTIRPSPSAPIGPSAAATRKPAAPAAGTPIVPPRGADANYFYREGRRLAADEKFAQALPLYNQALQLNPNFTLALNARCYAHLRLREYSAAIADCTEAIRQNPSYANAYQNRGVARHFAGDRAGASEDFKKVAEFEHLAQTQNSKPAQRQ